MCAVIRVLGPLEVGGDDGGSVDIGSPRHREVLAALVVDAGRVVSTEVVLDRVWGEGARGATAANLHAVVSRLRGRLRDTGAAITTVAPGYRLDVDRGAVDAVAFADGLAAARQEQDPERSRALVGAALGLWRGPAYADVRLPFAEAEAARLDGLRVAAHELAVELDLALGRDAEVADRLPALVGEHPLRENLRASLMLALYRSGRQADALAVFADLREVLADELGLDPSPDLQQLHQRILEQDPSLETPLRADPAPAVEVPTPPAPAPPASIESTALVGRDRDVEYVVDLVQQSARRLVTLTGVGGVGKTSLATAVAEACGPAFADGVVVVELAALTDPAGVVPALGRALGLTSVEGGDALATVADHLRARHVLAVVDNLEHLLDAGPELARLVAACPRLTVLATSRTVLRVRGEAEYPVLPLTLPATADARAIAATAATRLFVARAAEASPGFAVDDDNAAAIGSICRRLGGIPLAIELAAARVRAFPPAVIDERLDEVMRGAGPRDLPRRQRTMQAAIDWSHDLLEPEEQRVLAALGAFAGGFTLDAAEAVVGRGVLPDLESLVEQSLLLPDRDHPDVARFRMLEPVRQYAAARLTGDAERRVRDAHLAHFLALAEATEPSFRSDGTVEALALVERERANFVAAIEHALATGEADLAGRMGWALWLYWWLRGDLIVGRRLMTAVLELDPSPPVRTRALAVEAAMCFAQGDLEPAERSWAAGAALGRDIDDPLGEGHNVAGIGLVALATGDLDGAERALRATIPLVSDGGDATGPWLWTLAHVWLGTVRLLQGRADQARPLLDTALHSARTRGDRLAVYIAQYTAAQVALVDGRLDDARAQLEEGILLSQDTGDMANLAYFLDALAVVEASGCGPADTARVGVLHGASQVLRETVGANVYGYYQPDTAQLAASLATAESARGRAAYADDVARGRGLAMPEMIAFATSR
jgi:predicted ATPase/DNA-binding SARP family transcriptional activator